MIARNARPSDATALDTLLKGNVGGDVRIDRDIIVVSGSPANGTLVWRPCALVHEFECPGLLTANALVNFAVGQAAGRTGVIRDALFLVTPDNTAMLRQAKRLGAVELPGRLFSIDMGG